MRESGFMNHLFIDLVTITFAHPPSLKLQSGLCLSTSCFHWIEIYENLVDSTQIQHHGNSSFSKYLLGTKCVPKWLKRCFFLFFSWGYELSIKRPHTLLCSNVTTSAMLSGKACEVYFCSSLRKKRFPWKLKSGLVWVSYGSTRYINKLIENHFWKLKWWYILFLNGWGGRPLIWIWGDH